MQEHRPHTSVLIDEIIKNLNLKTGIVIDATFGAGGYSQKILEHFPEVNVIGIDRDESVVKYADILKSKFQNRFNFIHDKFSNLKTIIQDNKINDIVAVLYDFGVSSMQFDEKERGFSFSKEAKLNMSMGLTNKTAYEMVNFSPEGLLADIIFHYSDEKFSRRIAKAIAISRKHKKIETTTELAEIVKKAIPFQKNSDIHPATRTFQAIRIAVNDELEEIKKSLQETIPILPKDTTIACVSFHYTEDRIVKTIFNDFLGKVKNTNRNDFSEVEDKLKIAELLNKKPIYPNKLEIDNNPRARSAILRMLKKT